MASAECPSDDEDLEECEPGTGGSAMAKKKKMGVQLSSSETIDKTHRLQAAIFIFPILPFKFFVKQLSPFG